MSKLIFVNLPVADLPAAKAFYEAIGAVNNPTFTDETAACMVFSGRDPRDAADPRQVRPVHAEADRRRAARPARC